MRYRVQSTAVALAVLLAASPAFVSASTGSGAQGQATSVSSSDMSRLQVALSDARSDVNQLKGRNATLAERLTTELEEISDEVTYLKVRLRKEKSVPRSEYMDLRDRIDDLRAQARGNAGTFPTSGTSETRYPDTRPSTSGSGSSSSSSTARRGAPNEIPSGQELDVRLQTGLNSGTAAVEDRFEATTLVDLVQDERVLVPAGSVLRGVVTSVDPATRTDRKGSLTLSFDQLTVNGRNHPIRATVTQALESEGIKGETGRIATGAGVGAIIGGILGGFKGALAGILIGGGGTVAATEGKNVDLPAGTVLRVRFDSPVVIR